jgi:hypothetical protein
MQVVFHLGAPCTDNGVLLASLLKDRALLAAHGTIVPPLMRYSAVVRDTAMALSGRPASPEVQEALLEAIVDEARVDRLIFSDPRQICINRLVVQGAQIWPMIERQTANLRALFPQAEISLFIGMRNPATLIPALFTGSRFRDFHEFTQDMQPHAVAWSEMLHRLRSAHPDLPVTVWCNEDTPLLWGEILRKITALPADIALRGIDDLAETIMDKTGFAQMQSYLAQTPPETEAQRRRILGAFLDRYALDSALEEELDLPGWTPALIETVSQSYDRDISEIATIPGVTLLRP